MSVTIPPTTGPKVEPGKTATSADLSAELRQKLSEAQWRAPAAEVDDRRVEVAHVGEIVALRDSAQPNGPYLIFDSGEWEAFLAGVELGEFDITKLMDGQPADGATA